METGQEGIPNYKYWVPYDQFEWMNGFEDMKDLVDSPNWPECKKWLLRSSFASPRTFSHLRGTSIHWHLLAIDPILLNVFDWEICNVSCLTSPLLCSKCFDDSKSSVWLLLAYVSWTLVWCLFSSCKCSSTDMCLVLWLVSCPCWRGRTLSIPVRLFATTSASSFPAFSLCGRCLRIPIFSAQGFAYSPIMSMCSQCLSLDSMMHHHQFPFLINCGRVYLCRVCTECHLECIWGQLWSTRAPPTGQIESISLMRTHWWSSSRNWVAPACLPWSWHAYNNTQCRGECAKPKDSDGPSDKAAASAILAGCFFSVCHGNV